MPSGFPSRIVRDRPSRSRAIILLTDGEDNASTIPPLQAAKLAQQYGIHIYTIVIGKEGIVPIPDESGEIVMAESHVDTTLTRQIAEMTGGAFYTATNQKSLSDIYDRIDALEKSEAEAQQILIRKPLYTYPMGMALALLAIINITGLIRRGSFKFNQFSFEQIQWLWALALIPILWLFSASGKAFLKGSLRLERFADRHLLPHLVRSSGS